MKNIILLFILLIPAFLFAQYPATGNKQRLGYQTTGDGLIWRGVAADTAIKPRTINNAYFQLDTVNGVLRRYIATRGSWQTVSGGGGGGLTMPFDSITFNPTTADPDTAELKYNADLETFVFGADGTVIEIGQKSAWYVKNQTGSTITKGTVVRASGTLGSSGRILISPMVIDGTVDSKYLLGITASDIADGSDGYVIHFGKLRKFNTSSWSDGAVLYAGTGGTLTATEPNPPNLRLPIAFVVHSHATNGILAIRIQTGNELHELHDVDTTGIDNGGVIVWNAASEKWEASNGAALTTADTTSLLATKYWTNSNFFPLQGGTLTGTGGAGFIGFPSQVSAPGTPASGLNVYAQGSSFNWKGTDGYERQFASTLTGGRTYTLPDVSGTFALGTGTTDRSARWSATNTLATGNFTDNGTKLEALLPFQFKNYTTAALPTGVTRYTVWDDTKVGPAWYQGSRWAYGLESTFNRGTATRIPYFDANGQVTESANMTYVSDAMTLTSSLTGAVPLFTAFANPGSGLGNVPQFLLRNTNATSNKVEFKFGGTTNARQWSFGSDINGGGEVSFFLYANATNRTNIFSTSAGNTIIGYSGIPGASNANYSLEVSGTNAIGQVVGTNTQRPSIVSGKAPMRWNTDSLSLEVGYSATWYNLASRAYARSLFQGSVPRMSIATAADNAYEAKFNGDVYVMDSTRLGAIPNQTTATKILSADASGWVGYRAFSDFASSNIYTSDGSLSADRTLHGAGYTLRFNANTIVRDSLKVANLADHTDPDSIVTTKGGWLGKRKWMMPSADVYTGTKSGFIYDNGVMGFENSGNNKFGTLYTDTTGYYELTGYENGGADYSSVYGNTNGVNSYWRASIKSTSSVSDLQISFSTGLRYNGTSGSFDFQVDTLGTTFLYKYGAGTKEATDLSKTKSNYIAGFATDGTVLDLERKRDTTIFVTADTDYDFSAAVTTAQIASRYNRIIIHMTLTSGVGADKTTTLHAPDANLMQCEILIRGTDNTGTYDNEIAFGTNNAISSDGTNTSGYTLAQGQGLHVRVVYNGSAYKYIYY